MNLEDKRIEFRHISYQVKLSWLESLRDSYSISNKRENYHVRKLSLGYL